MNALLFSISVILTSLPAFAQLPQQNPADPIIDYVVGPRPLRTHAESLEVCTSLGRRFPTPDEAFIIYRDTVKRGNILLNYDGTVTSGSFWTNGTQGIFDCPLVFVISRDSIKIKKTCSNTLKLLTVCGPYSLK